MRYFFLFISTLFIFASCENKKKEKIIEIGDIDMAAVATDTLTQHNLERSFEFQKDIVFDLNSLLAVKAVKYTENGKLFSKTSIVKKTQQSTDTLFTTTEFYRIREVGLLPDKTTLLLFCSLSEDNAQLFSFDINHQKMSTATTISIGTPIYEVYFEKDKFVVTTPPKNPQKIMDIIYQNNQFSIIKK